MPLQISCSAISFGYGPCFFRIPAPLHIGDFIKLQKSHFFSRLSVGQWPVLYIVPWPQAPCGSMPRTGDPQLIRIQSYWPDFWEKFSSLFRMLQNKLVRVAQPYEQWLHDIENSSDTSPTCTEIYSPDVSSWLSGKFKSPGENPRLCIRNFFTLCVGFITPKI